MAVFKERPTSTMPASRRISFWSENRPATNASLTGNYGITSSGFAAQGKGLSGNEAPWALVGVIAFDGAGNFSSTWTYASNGVINRGFTGSGTYTVNPDCTGSSVFTSGPAGFSFDVVIVSGGAEVFLIATSPGNTITFDLKKQ